MNFFNLLSSNLAQWRFQKSSHKTKKQFRALIPKTIQKRATSTFKTHRQQTNTQNIPQKKTSLKPKIFSNSCLATTSFLLNLPSQIPLGS
jgi:hypothetical protein